MTEKKETIVSKLRGVAAILREHGHEAEAAFIDERAELQEKRNTSKGGETKTHKENVVIAERLYEAMESDTEYRVTQLFNLGIEGICSSSKATSVVKILVDDGRAIQTKAKGVTTYRKQ